MRVVFVKKGDDIQGQSRKTRTYNTNMKHRNFYMNKDTSPYFKIQMICIYTITPLR